MENAKKIVQHDEINEKVGAQSWDAVFTFRFLKETSTYKLLVYENYWSH